MNLPSPKLFFLSYLVTAMRHLAQGEASCPSRTPELPCREVHTERSPDSVAATKISCHQELCLSEVDSVLEETDHRPISQLQPLIRPKARTTWAPDHKSCDIINAGFCPALLNMETFYSAVIDTESAGKILNIQKSFTLAESLQKPGGSHHPPWRLQIFYIQILGFDYVKDLSLKVQQQHRSTCQASRETGQTQCK